MSDETIGHIFRESQALLEGHFLLTSGLHSDVYFEKFALLQQPHFTEMIGQKLADKFKNENIDVVLGPAVGGILLAHEVGKALGTRAIFTERVDDKMALRRGFAVEPGERVLIVEDVVTTGGSVRELLHVVRAAGGTVAGVGLMVDRSAAGMDFGVPTEALYRLQAKTYEPEQCPLCRQGLALTQRGSRGKPPVASRQPVIGVVMGSQSDLSTVRPGLELLKQLDIPFEVRIISAHRTPEIAAEYACTASERGLKVIVAAAGLAAHLAGVLAAYTLLPVVGIPMGGGPLSGVDALYATVQMPPGTPVGCVSIDGAVNAVLLAARIVAATDDELASRLARERQARQDQVVAADREVFTAWSN